MTPARTLRLWPAIAIAIVQLLVMFGAPVVFPEAELPYGMMGGVAGALLITLWWLFLSRAPWLERIGIIALIAASIFATRAVAHTSMVGAGQGMLIYILPIPYFALALVAWAVLTSRMQDGARHALLALAVLLVCVPFVGLRTSGIYGGAGSKFHLRWTPTPEEILVATAKDDPKPLAPAAAPVAVEAPKEAPKPGVPVTVAPAVVEKPAGLAMSEPDLSKGQVERVEWSGFRGPARDGVIRGVSINTDWAKTPPVELWRKPIGPGWSSFSVQGDLIFTQEQRGEDEVVACYRLSTGEPVWKHKDHTRFYESNGGAGPRATPTLSGGRVYAHGATGMLNALDARTGKLLWSRNTATDTKREVEFWGFSSSPLVLDDLVVIAASGTLAAYDRETGAPRWVGPQHGGTYSSPQLITIDGVPQILLLSPPGAVSVSPADGKVLWQNKYDGGAIVQPNMTEDGDVIISALSMMGSGGVRRLNVSHASGEWKVEERWTSTGLKPYFNDFVVHKGHAYGFDGSIMSCIDLADGKRSWKGGRYGNGQVFLLADQDLLLVTSEEGEIALVSATPDKYTEIARMPALNSKTWNHPVLVGDRLLVRNGEEMVAFKLSLTSQGSERVDAGSAPRR